MRSLFLAQRAAEEFNRVLDGTASKAVTDRHADLLAAVTVLRNQPQVLPRADFVGDLRSRLMTAAPTATVTASTVVRHLPAPRTTRGNRRLGTVAASLVLVGGGAGMAAAASGSLPGDGLYPIKRGVEQAVTAAHRGDAGKGKSLLDQAANRLEEVRSLQAQRSPDSALVAATLTSFRHSAVTGSDKLFQSYQAGGDVEDISSVRTFTSAQMTEIAALAGTSATTDALLVDAADTLADIDQQARALCGTCPPVAPLTPPDTLSFGAGAATIDRLLVRPVSQAQVDLTIAGAADLTRLKAAAERSAAKTPLEPGGSGAGSGTESSETGERPVISTITPQGSLVPAPTSGVAVTDLVSGVTGSHKEVTAKVPPGKSPVGDVTDPVDQAAEDLLP